MSSATCDPSWLACFFFFLQDEVFFSCVEEFKLAAKIWWLSHVSFLNAVECFGLLFRMEERRAGEVGLLTVTALGHQCVAWSYGQHNEVWFASWLPCMDQGTKLLIPGLGRFVSWFISKSNRDVNFQSHINRVTVSTCQKDVALGKSMLVYVAMHFLIHRSVRSHLSVNHSVVWQMDLLLLPCYIE